MTGYLNIAVHLWLANLRVTNMETYRGSLSLLDLTIEEVKRKYDITEDLTPELEETLRKEYHSLYNVPMEN